MRTQIVRNPFYAEIQRSGIIIDVPRTSTSRVTNPYYEHLRRDGGVQLVSPVTPTKREPSTVRSVRLPARVWKLVEKQAKREHVNVNAAIREAVAIWLRS